MKPIKKAVCVIGEYTDNQGQPKKRYHTIGRLMQDDKGNMSLKVDAMPVGGDWNGWINFYELDNQNQPMQQQGGYQQPAPMQQPMQQQGGMPVDDIPF